MAFATGTSWGTFAIMIPLALPVATAMLGDGAGVSIPLVVSAVLGGGVFGDHCSPISDTTLISSMAAWSDHIDHVRTQLPYALAAGAAALGLYVVAGLLISSPAQPSCVAEVVSGASRLSPRAARDRRVTLVALDAGDDVATRALVEGEFEQSTRLRFFQQIVECAKSVG